MQLQLKVGTDVLDSTRTGEDGHGHFQRVQPASYGIVASKAGFEPSGKTDVDLGTAPSTSIGLTLLPSLERRDSVEVKGVIGPPEQNASSPEQLP
ncbi:MAG: hypothetical protein QOJ99_2282, partial [Bryobacterales bacterium]|nr:hypothetical protein [Bryobacterales bacterium]